MIDSNDYDKINYIAQEVKTLVKNGEWAQAYRKRNRVHDAMENATIGLDVYNILKKQMTNNGL